LLTGLLSQLDHNLRHARPCAGHPRLASMRRRRKAWMAGTSPAMTMWQGSILNSASREVPSHERRAFRPGAHLALTDVAREIFHAAVGRDHDALGWDERKRRADALRDRLCAFDRGRGKVDDAENDNL